MLKRNSKRTRSGRSGRLWLGALLGGVLVAVAAVPAMAGGPDKDAVPFTITLPDWEREKVVFMNTTRADYCTPAVVAFEVALLKFFEDWEAWYEGGMNGPEPQFPPEPNFPDGNKNIQVQEKVTGKGAIVAHARGSGLATELWPMVNDPPGVGPCTDSIAGATPWSGTGQFRGNDNDLEATDTRGNAFGDWISAKLTKNGQSARYTARFHVNSRCYLPEDGPPKCLIESSRFVKGD